MHARLIIGLVLIAVGVGLFLDIAGIADVSHVIHVYWPLILIAVGLALLSGRPRGAVAPLVLIAVGTLFLLVNIGAIPGRVWQYAWPVALIALGVAFLLRTRAWAAPKPTAHEAALERTAFLSGFDEVLGPGEFRGAKLTTFLGGGKLDLRQARLAPGGAVIDASATLGGIELLIPTDWPLVLEASPMMRGVHNGTRNPIGGPGALVIRASALAGGVDVKN